MPSGSHGGSSGSHFSGGGSSSSGGGSHGGSHFGSYRRSWRSGTVIIGNVGGGYHLTKKGAAAQSFLCVLLCFSVILLMIGGMLWASTASELTKIKEDYNYYQQMISYAEANPDLNLIKTGTITGKFYNEDCKKWYITYSLETVFGTTLEGYSFSVYTLNDLSKEEYQINSPISLAVDSATVTSTTDSIPMDYKDMPLSRDGEWVNANNQVNIGKGMVFVNIGVTVVAIVLLVVVLIKCTRKSESEAGTSSSNSSSTTSLETNSDQPRLTGWTCEYCGSYEPLATKKCSQCGAKKPQRKNPLN